MGKEYISDRIGDEHKEWKKGDVILIKSPTGSGKSEFIKNQLLKWCDSQQKTILLLSNRTLLFQQQKNDIRQNNGRMSDKLTLDLYQTFSGNIEDYDYVVCDECHYFYEDASFSRQTDTIYKKIKKHSEGVVILLSATPELIEKALGDEITKTYELAKKISNYNLYKYSDRKKLNSIIEKIRKDHPNEKIIFFSRNVKNAYEASDHFNDSAFICSKSNRGYAKHIDKIQRENIKMDSQFTCNLLCATTVLDNGVNIKDNQVKHIILDVFYPVATVQCFGRKRLEENELVNIYLRDCDSRTIWQHKNKAQLDLDPYNDFNFLSIQEFAKKYSKIERGRTLDFDPESVAGLGLVVNECVKDLDYYIINFCDDCLNDKGTYFRRICENMGIDPEKAKDISLINDCENLELMLEKWEGMKLYKNDRELFVDNVFKSINGLYLDERLRGIEKINAIIEEFKLPYTIKNDKNWDKKDPQTRGRVFWIVEKNSGKENTEN